MNKIFFLISFIIAGFYGEMTQQCKDYFPNSPIVTAIKSHEAKTPGTANCRNGTADCKCQEGKTWCIANYIATMGERLGCRK